MYHLRLPISSSIKVPSNEFEILYQGSILQDEEIFLKKEFHIIYLDSPDFFLLQNHYYIVYWEKNCGEISLKKNGQPIISSIFLLNHVYSKS
jgi:hypothetical protein